MTDNKSFRITNMLREQATVWPISEHYHNVLWDGVEDAKRVASNWVADYFADGTWTKIEESLPRTFKYYHVDEGPELVNTWNDNGITVCYDGCVYYDWGAEEAKSFIERGIWIVLPSEPVVNLPEGTSNEILEACQKIVDNLTMPEKKPKIEFMTPEVFADQFEDILQRQAEDAFYVSSPNANGSSRDPDYSISEDADKLIAAYTKAVSFKNKQGISKLSFKIEVDSSEANKQLAHTIALARELEEAIKSLRNVLGVEFVKIDIEGIV